MTRYVALVRAANVGGTGKLPMTKLKALCVEAGFTGVETYIASGNVMFASNAAPARVKAELESRLSAHAGKPVTVMVRTAREMTAVLEANPFPKAEPKQIYVFFLNRLPARDALTSAKGQTDEVIRGGKREIYVHYPSGMGRSKLRLPVAEQGTARNMNTVAKLAELASKY
jgi:uncharacterized protein (DUF1697 family)